MIFTNKNLLTIYLLVILFTITISFIVNRKQIKSLILMPFEKTKVIYHYTFKEILTSVL